STQLGLQPDPTSMTSSPLRAMPKLPATMSSGPPEPTMSSVPAWPLWTPAPAPALFRSTSNLTDDGKWPPVRSMVSVPPGPPPATVTRSTEPTDPRTEPVPPQPGTVILSPDRTMVAVPPEAMLTVWVEASQVAPGLAAADHATASSGAVRPAATATAAANRRVRGSRGRRGGLRSMTTKTLCSLSRGPHRNLSESGFDAAKGVACPQTDGGPDPAPGHFPQNLTNRTFTPTLERSEASLGSRLEGD